MEIFVSTSSIITSGTSDADGPRILQVFNKLNNQQHLTLTWNQSFKILVSKCCHRPDDQEARVGEGGSLELAGSPLTLARIQRTTTCLARLSLQVVIDDNDGGEMMVKVKVFQEPRWFQIFGLFRPRRASASRSFTFLLLFFNWPFTKTAVPSQYL